MLLGASLLATGGGSLYEKKKAFLQDVRLPITVIEADDLAKDDLLCTVYAVGSTSTQETNFSETLQIGIERVEAYAGKNLRVLFAGELGAEHLAIKAAAFCGADVLDADGTGGRAVPEIVQDQFSLYGRQTTPAFVVDSNGEIGLFENLSPEALEDAVRRRACLTQGLVLVFDHLIHGSDVWMLSLGTLKRSMAVGQCLREKAFNRFGALGLDLVDEAVVTAVESDPRADFFRATLSLQGKNAYTILIQNENLVLLQNNKPLVTCPHLIMLVDVNGNPIHNSQLENSLHHVVTIVTAKASRAWQTPRGHELFSPRQFGFKYDVTYAKT